MKALEVSDKPGEMSNAMDTFSDAIDALDDKISALEPDAATLFFARLLRIEEFVIKKFPNLKRGTSETTDNEDDEGEARRNG
jgi:hypothetical protein